MAKGYRRQLKQLAKNVESWGDYRSLRKLILSDGDVSKFDLRMAHKAETKLFQDFRKDGNITRAENGILRRAERAYDRLLTQFVDQKGSESESNIINEIDSATQLQLDLLTQLVADLQAQLNASTNNINNNTSTLVNDLGDQLGGQLDSTLQQLLDRIDQLEGTLSAQIVSVAAQLTDLDIDVQSVSNMLEAGIDRLDAHGWHQFGEVLSAISNLKSANGRQFRTLRGLLQDLPSDVQNILSDDFGDLFNLVEEVGDLVYTNNIAITDSLDAVLSELSSVEASIRGAVWFNATRVINHLNDMGLATEQTLVDGISSVRSDILELYIRHGAEHRLILDAINAVPNAVVVPILDALATHADALNTAITTYGDGIMSALATHASNLNQGQVSLSNDIGNLLTAINSIETEVVVDPADYITVIERHVTRNITNNSYDIDIEELLSEIEDLLNQNGGGGDTGTGGGGDTGTGGGGVDFITGRLTGNSAHIEIWNDGADNTIGENTSYQLMAISSNSVLTGGDTINGHQSLTLTNVTFFDPDSSHELNGVGNIPNLGAAQTMFSNRDSDNDFFALVEGGQNIVLITDPLT